MRLHPQLSPSHFFRFEHPALIGSFLFLSVSFLITLSRSFCSKLIMSISIAHPNVAALKASILNQPANVIRAQTIGNMCFAARSGLPIAAPAADGTSSIPAALLRDSMAKLFRGMITPLADGHSPAWDLPLRDSDGNPHIMGGALIPIRKGPDLYLRVIAIPSLVLNRSSTGSSLIGLSRHHAFCRVTSLSNDDFVTGDVKLDNFFYRGTSEVNRLRFIYLPEATMADHRSELRSALGLSNTSEDRKLLTSLSNQGPFNTAAASQPSSWVNQSAVGDDDFGIVLPAIFPLPVDHNLCFPADIQVDSTSGTIAAFSDAHLGDMSWLSGFAPFQLWLAACLTHSPDMCPSNTRQLSLMAHNSSSSAYSSAVGIIRAIACDHRLHISGCDRLLKSIDNDTSTLLEPSFPSDAQLTSSLPFTLPPFVAPFDFQAAPPAHPPQGAQPIAPGTHPTAPPQLQRPPPFQQPSLFHPTHASPYSLQHPKTSKLISASASWEVFGFICPEFRKLASYSTAQPPRCFPTDSGLPPSQYDIGLWDNTSMQQSPLTNEARQCLLACPLSNHFLDTFHMTAEKAASHWANLFRLAKQDESTVKTYKSLMKAHQETRSFFSTALWSLIVGGNIESSQLQKDARPNGFTLADAGLLHHDIRTKSSDCHAVYPSQGFSDYAFIDAIFDTCKWLCRNFFHPSFAESTILFRGIEAIESLCTAHDFQNRWTNPLFPFQSASLMIIESIYSLSAHIGSFATLFDSQSSHLTGSVRPTAGGDRILVKLIPTSSFGTSYNVEILDKLGQWYSTIEKTFTQVVTPMQCAQSWMQLQPIHAEKIIHSTFVHYGGGNKRGRSSDSDDVRSPNRPRKSNKTSIAPEGKSIFKFTPTPTLSKSQLVATAQDNPPQSTATLQGMRNSHIRFCIKYLCGIDCPRPEHGKSYCGYHLDLDYFSKHSAPPRHHFDFLRSWQQQHSANFSFTTEALCIPCLKPSS